MNFRMIKYTLGWIMLFEAGFFSVPMITAVAYGEWRTLLAFFLTSVICVAIGGLCILKKPEKSLQLNSG